MNTLSITNFREKIYEIAREITESHEPITITSKSGSLIMLAKDDFETLMETIYLHSVPGLSEEAKKAKKKDLITRDKLPW